MADVPDERTRPLFRAMLMVYRPCHPHPSIRIDMANARPRRFNLYHPEPLPSARERYIAEVNRVVAVLDGHLEHRTWLVGDKCTFADLAFVMWNMALPIMMQAAEHPERWVEGKYPHFQRWQDSMMGRESVKKCLKVRQEMMDQEGRSVDGRKADGSS